MTNSKLHASQWIARIEYGRWNKFFIELFSNYIIMMYFNLFFHQHQLSKQVHTATDYIQSFQSVASIVEKKIS